MPRLTLRRLALFALLVGVGCAKQGASHDTSPALVLVADDPLAEEKKPAAPVATEPGSGASAGRRIQVHGRRGRQDSRQGAAAFGQALGGLALLSTGPAPRALPPAIANPEAPAAKSSAVPPRLPASVRIEPRPIPLPDWAPLELAQLDRRRRPEPPDFARRLIDQFRNA